MQTTSSRPSPAACVFDAYGTLFDYGGAVDRRTDQLGEKAGALIARWREKQLQYTWLRSLQNRYANFEQVTADALDYALDALELSDSTLRNDLLALYFALPAYPDASRALAQLRSAGIRALILSNGTPTMLERTLTASGLAPYIDGVLSVDSVAVYKPDPRVYSLATKALGVPAERVVFVSANGWDANAAAAFGFRALWCNRARQPRERLPTTPEHEIRSLDELLPYLRPDASEATGPGP
jgi:2-haloacid dehalogenase